MIPILFEEGSRTFTTKGIGQLADCISCLVTEERNGSYEVEFEYPVTGPYYNELIPGRIIYITHDNSGDKQPFVIYNKNAPLDGVVTYAAHHVSYDLSEVIVKPFTASSVTAALNRFKTKSLTDNAFTFWTDKSTAATFTVKVPSSIRSVLGGVEGSILDVYGGEYEFDGYTVKLHSARGSDRGVEVRYAKNLTELEQEQTNLGRYNSIVPFWSDTEGKTVVYGDTILALNTGTRMLTANWTNESDTNITAGGRDDYILEFNYYPNRATAMDFSSKFKDPPTKEQLEDAASAYLTSHTPWIAGENIKFNFADIKEAGISESVRLCDTVTLIFTALGVSAKAKIIKTVWNPLLEQYDSLEMGDARSTFADTITSETRTILKDYANKSSMVTAIENATSLITGGMGGHVVFNYDAEGKPTEIFIMDTEDIETATHVLRINVNGIGFSENGVSGPFKTAWTLDGHFVADFIDTGTLTANLIRSGMLASKDGSSYWDLDGSELVFYDKRFDSWVKLDEGYIEFGYGDTPYARMVRKISNDESVLVIEAATGDAQVTVASDKVLISKEHQQITLNDDYVRIWADGSYAYLYPTSAQLYVGDSKIRLYDDDYQFIDLNSGGNTYARIDGESGRIWLQSNQLMANGFAAYTGTATISGTTLTIKNGIITGVS